MVPPEQVEFMDVSPNQLVSVAASLIPFLENDDANRALMGSNMQRQAVPLLRTDAPLVGTGMERVVARDSGVTVVAERDGVVETVDATRIVVKADKPRTDGRDAGVDIYNLVKYQRSNQNTCMNQRPIVVVGDRVNAGDVIADGPSTEMGELALGRNIVVAFMPWGGYNFEDSILISERIVREDYFTSVHIEEFECVARDTKLGPEEITRDIPNVGDEALKDLDDSGIIRIGAEVKPGDILVGKITPKGETQLSPEEKLLRAIFGEKAGEVRDTSLRVPPGVEGTVINARVFSRKGVTKDERSRSIEEEEVARLTQGSARRGSASSRTRPCKKVKKLLVGTARPAFASPTTPAQGLAAQGRRHHAPRTSIRSRRRTGATSRSTTTRSRTSFARGRRDARAASIASSTMFQEKIERLKGGDELPPGVIKMVKVFVAIKRKLQVGDKMAGRHGNKGVLSRILPGGGHAVPRRRDAGRHRAEPARRSVPHERRPDPRDPSRVGRARARTADWPPSCRATVRPAIESVRRKLEGVYVTQGSRRPHRRRSATTTSRRSSRKSGARHPRRLSRVRRRHRGRDLRHAEASRPARRAGRCRSADGRTGEPFEHAVTVGVMYMMKLHHLVDDKIHARSTGPYSLVTQQPLGGKAQFGGQRLGEMEVWALEAYGAAYSLQEMLTVKSGRRRGSHPHVRGDRQGRERARAGTARVVQRHGERAAEPGARRRA